MSTELGALEAKVDVDLCMDHFTAVSHHIPPARYYNLFMLINFGLGR